MRVRVTIVAVLLLCCLGAGVALAAFPQDPPNDPDFQKAEKNCLSTSVNDEEHHQYSAMSACAPLAKDPDNRAGMATDRAWREIGPGDPGTTIAYIEGGINWHDDSAKELVNQVFLNKGELPAPTTPVDDGRLNVKDYADTKDANGNGYVDPEDLIVRFSDGKDTDGNGYVDDISGWDFYDHQNDPATIDGAYDHANSQQRQAAAEADNGLQGTGVCPGCTIVPIKAGAEALDRTDDLAQAWLYAGDIGAKVIVSVTADLGYSSFMRQAVDSLWAKGVVMVEASNDFDSTDHQGGMYWPHVLPGNGLVTNSEGISGPAANALTTTFNARSGYSSWGTHNVFSASTQGGTTSEDTPTVGGVMAMVLSAGRAQKVTGPEAVQLVRATATDINDPSSNWPSKAGWDLQFGYGRPDVYTAAKRAAAGDVPPVGWIDSPDWYALFDPTKTPKVDVTGHVAAPRSSSWSYRLELAPGAEPTDGDFATIGSGSGSAAKDGSLGTADLSKLPEAFWSKAFTLSKTKTLETNEQYTVTLRLRVTDAQGRVGEDRRTIAVQHDPSTLAGFPVRIGHGGEGQPQLADLQGTGHLAAVFGDSDGLVHAIDGRTGKELSGFPVGTRPTVVTKAHAGVSPGREPVVNDVAVGDLDGDGKLSVVATSTTGRVYVWGADGRARPGWPQTLDTGVETPAIPRPDLPFTRLPHLGASSPPVLADLDGDGALDVIQSGWDGRLHAWNAAGHSLKGWPVEVRVPGSMPPASGNVRVDDRKLDTPPALADLDGDGKPELVVKSQQFDAPGAGLQFGGMSPVHAYHADGSPVAGFPVKVQNVAIYYGSAQEFITEGVNVPSVGDVDGDGKDDIAVASLFSPVTVLGGDGKVKQTYGPVPNVGAVLGNAAGIAGGAPLPADAPVNFTTSGAFGRVGGGGLSFAEPGSGLVSIAASLLLTGSGNAITNSMRAFDASSGASKAGFPAAAQGLDFLSAPVIGDISGDGKPDIVEGGDSSALHGFASDGSQAPGFPKFTTGWVLWGPSLGDLDGDGSTDVVAMTREGYLMAWRTKGRADAGNDEWWSYRHDERNTSRYGVDTRPPGAVRSARLSGSTVSFVAPGDDWYAGAPASYRVTSGGRTVTVKTTARAGSTVRLPAGTARPVTVQAVDDAGNRGTPVTLGGVCASRRALVVTLPRGSYAGGVTIRAGGRVVKGVRRGRRVSFSLAGLPKGAVVVTIRARHTSGARVAVQRTFHLCVPRGKA